MGRTIIDKNKETESVIVANIEINIADKYNNIDGVNLDQFATIPFSNLYKFTKENI